jgi:hypothetical protein
MPERPRPNLDRVREAMAEHDAADERDQTPGPDDEEIARDKDEAPEDDGDA